MTPMRPLTLSMALALYAASPHASAQSQNNQPQGEQPPSEHIANEPAPDQSTQRDARQIADADTPQRDPLSLSIYANASYSADTDFDRDIGELQLSEYHAGINALIKPESGGSLSLTFDAGLLDYDITPATTSVPGDAASIGSEFDDIYTLSLIGIYSNRFNDETGWFVGGGVLAGYESDADFGDSLDWLVTAGVSHKLSENLDIGLGVAVKSRLDDGVLIIPVPQIRYTIDERWSIESQRAGLRLNYKSSENLSYGIMGEYSTVSFRLDDSHALAPEAMATHRRIPVAIYALYKPQAQIEISGQVGAAFAGQLEILDTNGDGITKQDIDTAVFGSLNVSFRF